MTTAALANNSEAAAATQQESSNPTNTNTNTTSPHHAAQQQFKKTAQLARGLADDASRAIGNLLPTASLQQITTRKYTLPDKTVASQVLMYRQLLHTSCRTGLKLSRPYQATPAQKAVMHMPWWEEGIEESKKMVISYDNLITRLWLNGAIEPFNQPQGQGQDNAAPELLAGEVPKSIETFITAEGLPPIPHPYWVERLGFQQPDPVTDFRSGGVLSLAMLVYMVESCPKVCQRFFLGDTSVLPFGITCINVTDMIAKFLMLAKSTDRMDALISQKPFWRMFGDPNAILAVQELAMTMLCDVVVELGKERQVPELAKQHSSSTHGDQGDKVTVFDFTTILERTERRVRDDLLGAGPKSVDELRSIAGRLRVKYQHQLDRRIQRAQQQHQEEEKPAGAIPGAASPPPQMKDAMDMMDKAGNFAGGFFAKIKNPGFGSFHRKQEPVVDSKPAAAVVEPEPAPTMVDLPPLATAVPSAATTTTEPSAVGGDWAGTDIAPATDAISNFSIGDEDDDEDIL